MKPVSPDRWSRLHPCDQLIGGAAGEGHHHAQADQDAHPGAELQRLVGGDEDLRLGGVVRTVARAGSTVFAGGMFGYDLSPQSGGIFRSDDGGILAFDRSAGPVADTWPRIAFTERSIAAHSLEISAAARPSA